MIYLILAIFFNASLGITFKFFPKFKVNTLQAIVYNYITCSLIGITLYGDRIFNYSELIAAPWLPYGFLLGCFFVLGFFISAKCIEYFGVALTAMMQKISMVLTVLYAVFIFGEPAGWAKWTGVILAIIAIGLVNYKEKRFRRITKLTGFILFLPLLTFMMNGIIDTTFYHMKTAGHNAADEGPFTAVLFIIASIIGIVILSVRFLTGSEKPAVRNVVGGIVLGSANFLSVFCILNALNLDWGGSIIFPVLSIGVILLAAFAGLVVFREKLRPINIVGILLAVVAILLIANR